MEEAAARSAAMQFAQGIGEFWQRRLEARLLGVYVIGSLAHGGFSARYSDIDMAVLGEGGLSQDDLAAMRAAAVGGCIVVLRNQFRDGLGEFGAESRPVRRRPEANLGIHRQGRQAFARFFRATNQIAHFADDPCAQCDEIAR